MLLKTSQDSQKTPLLTECLCNKVGGPQAEFLLRKRPWHRCSSVIFAKFLRTLPMTTSYSSGRYPETYPGITLKTSK